ncbi:hypothetical protein OROHE_018257 [Orobanche hederae]
MRGRLRLRSEFREREKKKVRFPDIDEDPEYLLRLMKRPPPAEREIDEDDESCPLCLDVNAVHPSNKCPYLDRIPPGAAIGLGFDEVCMGCGRIGQICCSKGAYAIRRKCSYCGCYDHWMWENRCTRKFRKPKYLLKPPTLEQVEKRVQENRENGMVMDNSWSSSSDDDDDDFDNSCYFNGKKLRMPGINDDLEEVLRLMKRIPPAEREMDEDDESCPLCLDVNAVHPSNKCPYLDRIPPGAAIGPGFDKVCMGCGRIGQVCCSKGAYAIRRKCSYCGCYDHWWWENRCTRKFRKPKYLLNPLTLEQVEERVLKNRKGGMVMKKDDNEDNHDIVNGKTLRMPDIECDKEVHLRLMKSISPAETDIDEDKVVVEEDDKNIIMEVLSTEPSIKNSLLNKEEDEVMVNVRKANKDKYEVMVEDEDDEKDDDAKGAKGGNESSEQSRSEKKSHKAMLNLGMKQVTGVSRVIIKDTNQNLFFKSKPDVFKSPNSDTYIIFGEAKMEQHMAGGNESSEQSRSEKKSHKGMLYLGMKQVTGVSRVIIKDTNQNLFFITKPDVFRSPNFDTYIIFGEAKMEQHMAVHQLVSSSGLTSTLPDLLSKLEMSRELKRKKRLLNRS